ncbi:MAG TPA: AAA family ATPase [Terriglobales bacterium]|nr:AAA family ATPase [Terriglobales bacterium]
MVQPATEETGFFAGDDKPRPEIVEGLIREGQLVTFAGPYGMGKSPTLTDLAVNVIHGAAWCGRQVVQRPVVAFDFETPKETYRRNVRGIAGRLGFSVPRVPEELDIYLEHADPNEAATRKLLSAIASGDIEARIALIDSALARKPKALVTIDPLELMFRVDTLKKAEVLRLYEKLRRLLAKYPHAAVIATFNLRKRDKKNGKVDLLSNPRGWLEEVCGSLDILNRSDVRLGIDSHGDESRVVNGIRRGEEMHPLVVRPIEVAPGEYAGFELCAPDPYALFTTTQREYWNKLPNSFRFNEVADKIVPRATLHRLVERARLTGLTEQKDGVWNKTSAGMKP